MVEGTIVTLREFEKYVAFLKENPRDLVGLVLDAPSKRLYVGGNSKNQRTEKNFLPKESYDFRDSRSFVVLRDCFENGYAGIADKIIRANASRRPKVNAYLGGDEFHFDKTSRTINGNHLFDFPGLFVFSVDYFFVDEEFF